MYITKIKTISITVIILVAIVIAFIGHEYFHKWEEEKRIEETNQKVQLILTDEIIKAEKLFHSKEELFQGIVNDTKNLPASIFELSLYDGKAINIRKDRDDIVFSLFNDCINGCFLNLNLIYIKTNNHEPTGNIIKLKDNWYLQKKYIWGT